ncbi:FecR domain-containing protein [Sinorhizobium sp. BG8]|uniref:FecR family protein n=1 Tax=Sinorhizobium sp. BG8 TaxID=2613773 RepID=UPI00193DFCA4|nr:FecR domain-containing protein [Sinorhizobium sp. BG8]QRM54361.1 DUF4880 domain-containing protein [Sinorhizobium sp. BG8]
MAKMNRRGNQAPVDITLSDEAIEWIVRLQSGRSTQEDFDGFAAWRSRSEEHERAAQEAETIWNGIGLAGSKVRARTTSRRAVLGAGVLCLGSVGLWKAGVLGLGPSADFATAIAEQRRFALPDGSEMLLAGNSAVSLGFDERLRKLTLLQGQAMFTVAKDAARPFLVEANSGTTRAIGTIFNVDLRPSETVVSVVEGVVEVSTERMPTRSVQPKAEQRVRYTENGAPSEPEDIDPTMETAWQRGKLIFNRRPLEDVVAEIERYRRGEIVIARSQIRSMAVTGVFDLSEPDAVLQTIAETLPVTVTRLPFVTIIR